VSSGGLLQFGPGNLLAVELPAFDAHVKDPHEAVPELSERLVVGLASSTQDVVVAPGAR
jgi:hypothetical protein